MSSTVDDSLTWLATRYVLGELTESERDAFESRLADDLAACEAVAEASRMKLALHAALADTAIGARVTTGVRVHQPVVATSRRSWLAVGTAMISVACLILAVTFWPSESVDPGVAGLVPTGTSAGSAVELVALWRTGMQIAEVELDDADGDVLEAASDVAVPGWLLAAVSLEKNGVEEGQPEERQDN